MVKLICRFYDARLSGGRTVTDIHWSSKHPELVLASYDSNPTQPNEARGQVLVWNMHLPERPEFVFHAQVSTRSRAHSEGGGARMCVGGWVWGERQC